MRKNTDYRLTSVTEYWKDLFYYWEKEGFLKYFNTE